MALRGKILVVEDDAAIRRGVLDALKFGGYATIEASDGEAGLESALRAEIDLVLLDILMPKRDGFSVLEELRKVKPGLPVICLTAKGTEDDRVRGLQTGADDYVVKPFSAKELLARVEAVLRRSAERPQSISTLKIAGRTIDFERREVKRPGNHREELSEKETLLLRYLASNCGRAIAREELLSRVWGISPQGVTTRTIDMHIARLRERLGDDPENPQIILTVRSKGYMLAQDRRDP